MKPIHVPRDADGWSLYRGKPGADKAGWALGDALLERLEGARALSISGSRDARHEAAKRIRDEMLEVMSEYEALGARDTEPETVLANVVGDFLRVELERW